MPTTDAYTKTERMLQLQLLFWRNPRRGFGTTEIAGRLGVSERTARNYLNELSAGGWLPVYRESRYWYLAEGASFDLLPVHLTLNEASVLYLAARLLARYSDEYNPIIAHALAKLASAMPEAIAAHIHHTITSLAYRPKNRTFARVLETIALGWATGRKARIWHQAAGSENVHDYLFSPYFLEPSSVGYATYAIGYSSWFEDVHTFKLERISQAELTDETFEIPEDFDGAKLLGSAWGVMFGDEVEEVILRFSPQVTRRVKESVWHPSQDLEDCDDGGCTLRLWVAHPLEMKPFIRGWGEHCEVLSPEWLRREIAEEMRRAAEVY
ncbi:MAG: WYL domain-containing transcriptional regulator [Anaerolineae bacterium]|nr:WYL domain-containing transcriptional regulator [Anaerolineae bacterium]